MNMRLWVCGGLLFGACLLMGCSTELVIELRAPSVLTDVRVTLSVDGADDKQLRYAEITPPFSFLAPAPTETDRNRPRTIVAIGQGEGGRYEGAASASVDDGRVVIELVCVIGPCPSRLDGGMDAGMDSDVDAERDADADTNADTEADADAGPMICGANERVLRNACVDCPAGTTNEPGDDASGADTSCEATLCEENELVSEHLCERCPPGLMNGAGDDASGPDTVCGDVCFAALDVPCDVFDEAYVKASNTGESDFFGQSVALSSDGRTLAVGAYGEDSGSTGIGGDQTNSGAVDSGSVYVFRRADAGWIQEAYIKASNTERQDRFGWRVALSGDGARLAVAADREWSAATGVDGDQLNNAASASGAVYVFERTGSTWAQDAYLKASNTGEGDRFGWSLAISSDGGTLAVAADREDSDSTGVDSDQTNNRTMDSGAVYVFRRAGGTWSQEAYLKASNTDAYSLFGWSVALSSDGSILAASADREDSAATGVDGDDTNRDAPNSGAVYVFRRRGRNWSQDAYLKASNTEADDRFGFRVALSSDGATLVASAPFEDSAATGVGGDQSSNAEVDSGAVYVFRRTGDWAQEEYLKASNTSARDMFGTSAALSLDGMTIAVGAREEDSASTGLGDESNDDAVDAGALYLFRRRSAWAQDAYIKSSNTGAEDGFGWSVAVSSSGATLATSAPFEDSMATGLDGDEASDSVGQSGAVYVRRVAP